MKKKHIAIFCCIGVILLVAFSFFAFNFYKLSYAPAIESYDVNEYISGDIAKHEFGDKVVELLPSDVQLGEYSDLYYHRYDARHKDNYFHNFFCTYTLKITYEKNNYDIQKNSILSQVEDRYITEVTGEVKGFDDICTYKAYETACQYEDVKGIVAFFDKECTIGYYVICDDKPIDGNNLDQFAAISNWNDGEW